jgi:uncharacterized protein (DUF1810 family)
MTKVILGREIVPYNTEKEWDDFWGRLAGDMYAFIHAQDLWNTYNAALQEIKNGKKETHWIWFIFPQMRSLGKSSKSKYYGFARTLDARIYLSHPILGSRLIECTEAFLKQSKSAHEVFGNDMIKFRSCMLLFNAQCENKDNPFRKVLIREHWL